MAVPITHPSWPFDAAHQQVLQRVATKAMRVKQALAQLRENGTPMEEHEQTADSQLSVAQGYLNTFFPPSVVNG